MYPIFHECQFPPETPPTQALILSGTRDGCSSRSGRGSGHFVVAWWNSFATNSTFGPGKFRGIKALRFDTPERFCLTQKRWHSQKKGGALSNLHVYYIVDGFWPPTPPIWKKDARPSRQSGENLRGENGETMTWKVPQSTPTSWGKWHGKSTFFKPSWMQEE